MIPNRTLAPLTPDEALAECYADLQRLRELAQETGNRALLGIAYALQREKRARVAERRKLRP